MEPSKAEAAARGFVGSYGIPGWCRKDNFLFDATCNEAKVPEANHVRHRQGTRPGPLPHFEALAEVARQLVDANNYGVGSTATGIPAHLATQGASPLMPRDLLADAVAPHVLVREGSWMAQRHYELGHFKHFSLPPSAGDHPMCIEITYIVVSGGKEGGGTKQRRPRMQLLATVNAYGHTHIEGVKDLTPFLANRRNIEVGPSFDQKRMEGHWVALLTRSMTSMMTSTRHRTALHIRLDRYRGSEGGVIGLHHRGKAIMVRWGSIRRFRCHAVVPPCYVCPL